MIHKFRKKAITQRFKPYNQSKLLKAFFSWYNTHKEHESEVLSWKKRQKETDGQGTSESASCCPADTCHPIAYHHFGRQEQQEG
jgi:hypothetical protein